MQLIMLNETLYKFCKLKLFQIAIQLFSQICIKLTSDFGVKVNAEVFKFGAN